MQKKTTNRIVQGEEAIRQSSMASINATVQVPRLKMTRVHIPFTFRLVETGNNSYEGKRSWNTISLLHDLGIRRECQDSFNEHDNKRTLLISESFNEWVSERDRELHNKQKGSILRHTFYSSLGLHLSLVSRSGCVCREWVARRFRMFLDYCNLA
jgi:hypothetical protein